MNAKLIEYAYPSSTTAKNAGFPETGCWFVRLYLNEDSCFPSSKPLAYFENKQDAINYAESIPNPYNFMHKYFNN
jgi:hypothetical protein